jgi:glyoxylase-like metal-dependent hydrolase (beta-lactamase superfamily II)
LVDVGWPGTLPKLLANLKRKGIALSDIRYLLVTHYHPDHAGLAQEVKAQGVKLIVLESQVETIPLLKTHMKPANRYLDIRLDDNLNLKFAESRSFLARLGLPGEIISTPGHSEDSVTLILDEGAAFTGDLTAPGLGIAEAGAQIEASWARLRSHHATTIYPGHGPIRPLV